ncbi:MAG: helix-turn-helix domain-containing protein [Methylocystis sp.]|uniref:helix-turn-helix domain-containing protein n=1 Tax=Methylocystis sp. TaxID=1911079 RepID=UPI003DA2C8E9
MDIREVLAINLRKSRQAQHLSQEELAHQAEIDRTYISSIERRVYAASIDVVDRLARVLGIEAADLLRKPTRGRKDAESAIPTTLEHVALAAADKEALTEPATRGKREMKPSSVKADNRKGAKSTIRKTAKTVRHKV